MEEKKTLIEEYAQHCWRLVLLSTHHSTVHYILLNKHKECKMFGSHATAKLKVNNITETLKAIENELTSLQYHTGAETMLYMMHGSTDLPLCGVAFATEGIENFMGTVMCINNQDLVLLQITNSTFPKCGVQSGGSLMLSYIKESTGEPNAKMQWAHYFHNVVTCHLVAIEGWPDCILFTNLSTVFSVLLDLEMLLRMWESGGIFWKPLNNQDYEALHHECDAKLNSGELIEEMIPTDTDEEDNAERDMAHNPVGVAATPGDRNINPTTAHTTNAGTSSDTHINMTRGLMPATEQAHHPSTAPYSATEQASHSSMHYPDQPITLHILEIDLDLALHNLNQSYDAMWLQGNSGDTYRFDDQDRHGFDDGGRYGFGHQNGIPFSYWASNEGLAPGSSVPRVDPTF
ncbi:hypothetical protein EDC04DRAFT_2600301 [Pisolithus marmoratus]|nr:hypothetical protein EDC04DRAFT_2600301 [Pisolithus marmoratus]